MGSIFWLYQTQRFIIYAPDTDVTKNTYGKSAFQQVTKGLQIGYVLPWLMSPVAYFYNLQP